MAVRLALLSALVLSAPTFAADQAPDTANTLRGHRFIRPLLQEHAFIRTEVALGTGAASFRADDLPAGDLGLRQLSMYGLQQALTFDLKVADWLKVDAGARGTAVLGANADSLLVRTGMAMATGDFGVAVRLYRNDGAGTQLTARASGAVGGGRDITVIPLLQSFADTPGLTLAAIAQGGLRDLLVVPSSSTQAGLGVHLAQAFGRAFSLQASLEGGGTWRTERPFDVAAGARSEATSSSAQVAAAVAAELDLTAVGLIGEYQLTLGRRSGTTYLGQDIQTHGLAAGIYYTGREQLQVGVHGALTFKATPLLGSDSAGAPARSGDVSVRYAQLALRYLW